MKEVTVVSCLLMSILRMTTQQPLCKTGQLLTGGEIRIGWLIRITRDSQTVGHGALVSQYKVLSVFWSFVDVAKDAEYIKQYDFVAYEERDFKTICYQINQANHIKPPPGWSPQTKLRQDVKDIAFWELAREFHVSSDFPYLFSTGKSGWNYPVPEVGSLCYVLSFSDPKLLVDGSRKKWSIILSRVRDCESVLCASEENCKLSDLFDYCLIATRDRKNARWIQGAPVICNVNEPTAFLSISGETDQSNKHTLIINFKAACELYEGVTVAATTKRGTTAVVTSSSTVTKTSAGDTTTYEEVVASSTKRAQHSTRQTSNQKITFLRTKLEVSGVAKRDGTGKGSAMVVILGAPTLYMVP